MGVPHENQSHHRRGADVMMLPFADILRSTKWDQEARALADRHYSRQKIGARQFIPPGETVVLRNPEGTWLFVWRKSKYRSDTQTGWNCSIFRNESKRLSSEIILACEKFVEGRKYTFVNSRKIKSSNPGCCFLKAGWKREGLTKGGLIILVKE